MMQRGEAAGSNGERGWFLFKPRHAFQLRGEASWWRFLPSSSSSGAVYDEKPWSSWGWSWGRELSPEPCNTP